MKFLRVAMFFIFCSIADSNDSVAEIYDQRSCFDGNFSSEKKYLEFIEKKSRAIDKTEALNKAKIRYEYWMKNFACAWFNYKVDGVVVQGFYAKPKIVTEKLPVIIFNHGGNADIGAIRSQYIYGKLFPIAIEGFLVIGSQYRGAGNNEYKNPDRLKDEFGGKDVDDVLALLPIIDKMKDVDATKIGLWGISRGGMMAYLAAAQSDRFKALVAEAAPHNLYEAAKTQNFMEPVFKTWIPNYESDAEKQLKRRSVFYWAEKLNINMPILLIHARDDSRVNAEHVLAFAQKLQKNNHPYRLVMFKDGGHWLRNHGLEVSAEIIKWFKMNLH